MRRARARARGAGGDAAEHPLLPYASRVKIIAAAVLAPVLPVTGLDPVTTVVSLP